MGSEVPTPAVDDGNETVETAENRCSGKSKGKVPKRVHKAEREKLKREQLNDLFLDLGNVLELTQPNNGKASILCEATRTLKELFSQIGSLKKDNVSLMSESNYVAIERNELDEEKSVLESEVEKLQSALNARAVQSKPDLNLPPPEFRQPELAPHFPSESLGLPAVDAAAFQQPSAVFVVPLHPDLHQAQSVPSLPVSKPHARYPTATDSWPSQILGDGLINREEVQFSDSNNGIRNTGK
uniref:Transcription factor bHLH47 isoform X2 n=1 Tax=Rhizophora mucronata TaxID=61149 RepID=A0A2P2KQ17_RHIMU